MLNKENWADILTIIIASTITISGIIVSFIYPNTQILILTILTILLPIIYQIGNIISKECVREENNNDYNILEEALDELEEENLKLRNKINRKS